MSESTYKKIEEVLKNARGESALAPHEFDMIQMPNGQDGRAYVGITESTLGRRLREMRELGRVTAARREGKAFVEYALAVKSVGSGSNSEFPLHLVEA